MAIAAAARGTRGFTLVGRLQLDYGQGPWNEWYAAFDDGDWGWVAEAQGKVSTPDAREYLARQVAMLEQSKRDGAEVDAFNAAVAQVNAGRLAEGRDALVLLLADCRQESLCARARELQADLDRRLQRRR